MLKSSDFAESFPEEKEVTLNFDNVTDKVSICSCWPMWSRRLERKYGQPVRTAKNNDGKVTTCWWELPVKVLSFRSLSSLKHG